jgi:exopolyphosphatase/guanosine-5'-triphosphate,3'-diphosphate pyrophosphatase
MKLAAIDLGSNSLHMVLVETDRSGSFRVIGQEKEMVRLGAGLARGRLSAEAMRRGLDTLRKYKRLAENAGADKVVAVATSAVREAANGEDFLERVGRELEIWPRAISGEEEARLIYLAALHSIHLEGRRTLVIDIGGGSVELALGMGEQLEHAVSEKIGVLRMTERFVKSDPLSARDEARLVQHLESALEPYIDRFRDRFEVAVGTSGTILALGSLALQRQEGAPPEGLHHAAVPADALRSLRRWLVSTDVRARLKATGLDEARADIIVAGSVILDTVVQRLGVRQVVLSEWALREGILLDYIHGHPRSLARAEAYPDVRRRSVVGLGERCQYDAPHARQVSTLALSLFDATRKRHGLGDGERSLLEYAALLHDIGHHISYPGHHKHTYYLVKNGDLRGFTPREVEVLANVARHHRRGHPRKKNPAFAALSRSERQAVRVLAGLLRVADALDRSHRQVVRALHVTERGDTLRLHIHVAGDCALELWGAPRRAALLEEVLGIALKVDAVPFKERAPAADRKHSAAALAAARS